MKRFFKWLGILILIWLAYAAVVQYFNVSGSTEVALTGTWNQETKHADGFVSTTMWKVVTDGVRFRINIIGSTRKGPKDTSILYDGKKLHVKSQKVDKISTPLQKDIDMLAFWKWTGGKYSNLIGSGDVIAGRETRDYPFPKGTNDRVWVDREHRVALKTIMTSSDRQTVFECTEIKYGPVDSSAFIDMPF